MGEDIRVVLAKDQGTVVGAFAALPELHPDCFGPL
ncbi:hypothetical protein A8926_3589 [Saccharopolyspora spinosa]|uniref:Uncharacterized protein n=1 Tax=Saccharopolyspora spinosa TaxID=60894 RepID=A0A2N3XYW7_SACSN|nr:hypothetical protein A8926_3589 [Saccharopolyspora spinosa]